MEITDKNRQEVLTSLVARGYEELKSHVEEHLKINETEYPIGSEWGTDKGYGCRFYLLKHIHEYISVMKEHNLIGNVVEVEDTIIEDSGKRSFYYLYLTGSENAVALYIVDED